MSSAHDAPSGSLAQAVAGDQLEITATDAGSVSDFQGWVKTNERAVLKEQRREQDETGRDLYIHLIERANG